MILAKVLASAHKGNTSKVQIVHLFVMDRGLVS